LHRDLGGGVGPVVAGAVDAAGVGDPVAFGEHGDRLGPARVRWIGPVRGDVPLVRTQRTARGTLGLGLRHARRAQARELVERSVVVRERRRAGLARDPVHARAKLGGEYLLARATRGAAAMAER